VTSPKISGLTGTLTGGMAITQTGFSFTNLTLGYTGTATIGSILSFTNPSLAVTSFSYDSTNSSNPVTATITLTVASASLFPDASVFTSTLTGIVAVYDFTGANPTGTLSLTVAGFSLAIGEALKLNATNIAITPSASTIATIASVTVTSPKITGLTGSLTNLAVTQTGFSFSGLTLAIRVRRRSGASSVSRTPRLRSQVSATIRPTAPIRSRR